MPPHASPPHVVPLPGGFAISDERARLDMETVHAALADAYWAADRPRALTERSWNNCLCLGAYAPDGALAGFGRVMTDYAFRAHLADVMVRPAWRGHGLGKAIVEAALGHPALATVGRWSLTTADAQALYARYGFRPGQGDGKWMVLDLRPGAVP